MQDFFLTGVLVGTLGAIVANITGIGGGVVFYPYLTYTHGDAEFAMVNSVYTQIVGMGMGSLCWLIRDGLQKAMVYDLLRIVLMGYLGMYIGNSYLQLNQDAVFILFAITTIALSVISLRYGNSGSWSHNEKRKGIYRIVEQPLFFASGLITSQISIGFGECVMLIRYLYNGNFRYAVRLAVTSTALLLIVFALQNAPTPDTSVVFPMALGTIPGAIIGFYLTSQARFQYTLKSLVFKFLIGFSSFSLIHRFLYH